MSVKSAPDPREEWEQHADQAAVLEGKGDEHQWQAAEEYAEAAKTAMQWQIADRVGCDESHISRILRAWEERQLDDQGHVVGSFSRAYSRTKAHVSQASGDNEWYTPAPYIAAAVRVMGGIDLDPASHADANEVVGATKFYTEADDGLAHGWAGRVWMNPPYARPLIDSFCGKLAEEYSAGNVSQAVTLTNNATETGWFHALAPVGAALCFPRHRVRFWQPGTDSATPLQGQALFYLGIRVDAFRQEFVQFGFTAVL